MVLYGAGTPVAVTRAWWVLDVSGVRDVRIMDGGWQRWVAEGRPVARGEETARSDVDVLVVGQAGFAEVVAALYPCQETLGRDINPVVYSPDEWRTRQANDDHFVRDILSKPTLPLWGDVNDAG